MFEQIPHVLGIKTGLINAVGPIFKTISWNRNANDSKWYEASIKQLQTNQQSSLLTNLTELNIFRSNQFYTTTRKTNHNK